MNSESSSRQVGRVASLHLHPEQPGAPLHSVESIELVEAKGIQGDNRYFGKISSQTSQTTRRQVSLIEREQLAEHAKALGMGSIAAGAVRSNIETSGINLISLLDREIQIGQARLFLYARRDPCAKMDALCQGLRARMADGHQGMMAEVRGSGTVRVGDSIKVV